MNSMRPLSALVWLAATAAYAEAPRAEQAWRAGDYRAAYAAAIEAAQDGDADAQYRIAEAYRQGKGVNADNLYAEVWYFRAAQQGHVAAAAELGAIYAAAHRTRDARRWLRFAVEHGDTGALGALAASLYNAPDGEQDTAEAFRLMTRAAASGSPEAQRQLARMQAASGIAPAAVTRLAAAPAAFTPAPIGIAAAPVPATPPVAKDPEAPRAPAPARIIPAAALTPRPIAVQPALKVAAAAPLRLAPQPKLTASPAAAPARQPVRLVSETRVPAGPSTQMWRVQVGAFRTTAGAQRAWGRLTLRVASLSSGTPLLSRSGSFVRVQATAASRAEAVALCRTIRAVHWACFLPRPRPLRYAQAEPLRATWTSARFAEVTRSE